MSKLAWVTMLLVCLWSTLSLSPRSGLLTTRIDLNTDQTEAQVCPGVQAVVPAVPGRQPMETAGPGSQDCPAWGRRPGNHTADYFSASLLRIWIRIRIILPSESGYRAHALIFFSRKLTVLLVRPKEKTIPSLYYWYKKLRKVSHNLIAKGTRLVFERSGSGNALKFSLETGPRWDFMPNILFVSEPDGRASIFPHVFSHLSSHFLCQESSNVYFCQYIL